MYSILGYVTLGILAILVSPYVLRTLNKNFLGNNTGITLLVKKLKSIHKPLGALVGIIALVHGYMALGGFRLHTGTLLYISMLITVCFGVLFHKKKKKEFLKLHKTFVLITICLFLLHYFFPSALFYLFN